MYLFLLYVTVNDMQYECRGVEYSHEVMLWFFFMFLYFGATRLFFSCTNSFLKETSCFSDSLLSFFPASVCVWVCVCVCVQICSLCFSAQWCCWCGAGTVWFNQWWNTVAWTLKCYGCECSQWCSVIYIHEVRASMRGNLVKKLVNRWVLCYWFIHLRCGMFSILRSIVEDCVCKISPTTVKYVGNTTNLRNHVSCFPTTQREQLFSQELMKPCQRCYPAHGEVCTSESCLRCLSYSVYYFWLQHTCNALDTDWHFVLIRLCTEAGHTGAGIEKMQLFIL